MINNDYKIKNFTLTTEYKPTGDQPNAIKQILAGIKNGLASQTLLGVTGSGKTFTMANVIAQLNRPTMILAPNKTLAAQLYSEMKNFFPKNAVEYFVSYYDYYQPEAYVPSSDTYIEKDASINAQIEQLRLSATKSFIERKDVIVVASVSAIYGLGDPNHYLKMIIHLQKGAIIDQRNILFQLTELQYTRNDNFFQRGNFRVRGDVIDIFPAESDKIAVRVELFDQEIERLLLFDPVTGHIESEIPRFTVYPKTHYATPKETIFNAIDCIKAELISQQQFFLQENRLVEEQRISEKTKFDIEMLNELGYCSGIENYSRYLSGRKEGEPPPTLFDYLPNDGLLIIDESHATIPQLKAMYRGDRSRKENLVKYGFRLPSALDNRPLTFEEFENFSPQTIYVSATPSEYELEKSSNCVIEQVVRPTGLLDPEIEVRPIASQVDDLLSEIHIRINKNERVLVTTLTKKMAEELSSYLEEQGIQVRYLHSDVDTVERVEIIRDLRLGIFDVLVGINLLREGLDMPEVSLVAILDADIEGFLRSERSLIQTIGRAARHLNGKAILYADNITKSMQKAIEETTRRREKQDEYNKQNNIIPTAINKKIGDILDVGYKVDKSKQKSKLEKKVSEYQVFKNSAAVEKQIKKLEQKMFKYAKALEFEKAAQTRDQIQELQNLYLFS